MSTPTPAWIWHQGTIKPWADATVHVMAHALHYGSSVFEGIRAYATERGPCIFRLRDHMKRFYNSARIYEMGIPFDIETLEAGCIEAVRVNGLPDAYLRPIAFRSVGGFGLGADNPTEVAIAAWKWGSYLGESALREGVDACISSWRRIAPNTLPAAAKAGGNYLSSILISREAKRLGFHEGIALTVDGLVSEGAGENLFLIFDGEIITPPIAASILHGITRDTVIRLARAAGIEVREQAVTREMLYLCDELFMTGTAAEVTPVRSVDRKPVGDGKPGPISLQLQQAYFDLVQGRSPDPRGWLTQV